MPSSPPVIGVASRFFSLDFLPDYDDGNSWSWELVDSRGGLLLFSKKRKSTGRWAAMADARGFSFPDLVVCEPLTRRYQGIASAVYFRRHPCLGVFLLDGDAADADDTGGGGIGMSNFRVVAALHDRTWQHDGAVPLACVFTSGSDGGWRVLQSAAAAAVDLPERFDFINFAGRAGGCLYWGIDGEDGAMLVLDVATMRFSIDMFPETIRASYDKWTFRVIERRRRRLRSPRRPRDAQRPQGVRAARRQRRVGGGEASEPAGGHTRAAGAQGDVLPARSQDRRGERGVRPPDAAGEEEVALLRGARDGEGGAPP